MEKNEYGLKPDKQPAKSWRCLYFVFALVSLLGASWWITQAVARSYGWHDALGPSVGHVYAPWMWAIWYSRFPDTYGVMADAINTGTMFFLFPNLLLLSIPIIVGRKPTATDDLHGSAHWATLEEVEKSGLLGGKGVYIGGYVRKLTGTALLWASLMGRPMEQLLYLRHDGPEHIMVFAPTRSGKGVSVVLTTLLSWLESVLILDIKGENWALTSGWRKEQGHRVFRFEPTDVTLTGAAFNPLEEIRLNSPYVIADAQNIGMMLVDPDGQGLKDYWNKAAFAFFSGATIHCMLKMLHEFHRPATLADLGYMLSDMDRSIREVFEEMLATDHDAWLQDLFGGKLDDFLKPDSETGCGHLHRFIGSSTREMLNKADSELSGVVSTALANMALYRDPVITANTSRCDFHLSDLMNNDAPVSVYLVFSPNDISRMRPLIRLIINLMLSRLTEKMEFENGRTKKSYKHRLLLMLDEFTSLGRMDIFQSALAYMAGYGIKAFIIIQDIAQLRAENCYGRSESITANCHIRIAYATNTPDTAKVLSEMTGKTTVVETKTSLSGSRSGRMKNASVTLTETARPLLTQDECGRLPGMRVDAKGNVIAGGDMLIFQAGMSPIYGRQPLYFLDPVFSARAKIQAPAESDRLGGAEFSVNAGSAKTENIYETALAEAEPVDFDDGDAA